MGYVIEHGIPMPPPKKQPEHKRNGPGEPFTPLSQAMLHLQVGASFLMPTEAERKHAAGRMGRFKPRRFSIRKIAGKGWRIWRVE